MTGGPIRYEHAAGPPVAGCADAAPPRARLVDVATGVVLFDGTAFGASRVLPQEDGSLLLLMEQNDRQSLFRIDPAAERFRDLAGGGPDRPLGALADAAAAAHAESLDPVNCYVGRRIAPDGSMIVELQAVEWGNTHWVNSPRIVEVASKRVLLDLWGSDWDAVVSFPRAGAVRMSMRRYHEGGGLEAEIDLERGVYGIFERDGAASEGPLAGVAKALEAASRRAGAAARGQTGVAAAIPRTVRGWQAVVLGVLILVGAFAAIAVGVWVTEWLNPAPAQKLTPLPEAVPRAAPTGDKPRS